MMSKSGPISAAELVRMRSTANEDTRNGWSECASYFYRLILNMLK